jgi:L-asparaginase
LRPPLQGLILQSFGTGNAPHNKEGFFQVLKEAIDRGVIVVIVTQCVTGSVDLAQYETGEALGKVIDLFCILTSIDWSYKWI